MINLRYHVVSLIAVFLALTVGIVMGSTVVDRVTVDALNERVSSVSRSVSNAEAENRRLNGELGTVRDFADQARDHLVQGRLQGVPVLVVAVAGVDRKPVDALIEALVESQATLAGTLWFTAKMRLDNDADLRQLATALNLGVDQPEVVRGQALARVADALAGTSDPTPADPAPADPTPADPTLAALTTGGFVTYEAPPGQATSVLPPTAPLPESLRVVLVSGAGAGVGDDRLALPLTQDLGPATGRLVATESGQDTPGGRGVFVGLVRKDDAVAARVSTVDNVETPMGQAAVVLALEDLAATRAGHFGVGPGAQRLLPAGRT